MKSFESVLYMLLLVVFSNLIGRVIMRLCHPLPQYQESQEIPETKIFCVNVGGILRQRWDLHLPTAANFSARGPRTRTVNGMNVFLCFLPVFHIFGLSVATFAQLQKGNVLVVIATCEMEKVFRAIEKCKVMVTHLSAVPPAMLAQGKQKELWKKYDVSSLKDLTSGAAPLGKDVMVE